MNSQRNSACESEFGPIPLPLTTFAVIGIDLFGPLRRPEALDKGEGEGEGGEADENDATVGTPHILTVCCRRTGYTRFVVMENAEARTVCENLGIVLRNWGCEGTVEEIWSDNGRQFLSAAFRALVYRLPGVALRGPAADQPILVSHKTIPVRTPHLGGHWETHHREAKHVFRTLLAEYSKASWKVLASYAEAKVNFHREAGYPSPHQLLFGREPRVEAERLPLTLIRDKYWDNKRPNFSFDVFQEAQKIDEQRQEYDLIWDDRFRQMRVEAAIRANKGPIFELKIGDEILVPAEGTQKFSATWKGPFKVKQLLGNLLRLEGSDRLWNRRLVKKFTAPNPHPSSPESSGEQDNDEVDADPQVGPTEDPVVADPQGSPTEDPVEQDNCEAAPGQEPRSAEIPRRKKRAAWHPSYEVSAKGRRLKMRKFD